MKFGIVVFPGSNCDKDVQTAARAVGHDADFIWHTDTSVDGFDCLVLPGGFSYGDYLRTAAIARFSPVMEPVARYAASGRPVIGICNGFQVLLEAGLLPVRCCAIAASSYASRSGYEWNRHGSVYAQVPPGL